MILMLLASYLLYP